MGCLFMSFLYLKGVKIPVAISGVCLKTDNSGSVNNLCGIPSKKTILGYTHRQMRSPFIECLLA